MDQDWNDGQPIYRQLQDRVVAMILDGGLGEGDPLPSVREVASRHAINPMTVSKAYSLLRAEGLLDQARGQGMVVAGAVPLLAVSTAGEPL